MTSTNALWAQTICENLYENGLRQVVLSPGSRNTPLVLALENIPGIEIIVVVDERSAAFFALGLSRISGIPVALLCTSGTAMAHYLPALIEAHHCHIPLLVLSADRPAELHYSNAPQTMEQKKIFAAWMKQSFCLAAPTKDISPRWLAAVSAQAMHAAKTGKKGPVHLNIPYRKPLWEQRPQHHDIHKVKYHNQRHHSSTVDESVLPLVLNKSRVLLLCGPHIGCISMESTFHEVLQLAEKMKWPVVADPLSQLRYQPAVSANVITTYDCFLRTERDNLHPQLIIQFGRVPTSKALNQWITKLVDVQHIIIDETGSWNDPNHIATDLIVASPKAICQYLIENLPPSSDHFLTQWITQEAETRNYLQNTDESILWEGKIAQTIIANLPDNSLLHVASGMPIRDMDGFGHKQNQTITLCANRGVNGIDGLIATACGQARNWKTGPCYALIGDIAFFHDLGSLHTAIQQKISLTLIVIDNGGGGIFENLPIANHPSAFERYFLTPQSGDICQIAKGFGIAVKTITDIQELKAAVRNPTPSGLTMLYVKVDRQTNVQLHHQIYQHQPAYKAAK